MKYIKLVSLMVAVIILSACAGEEVTCAQNTSFKQTTTENRDRVYSCYRMETSYGDIDLAVNKEKAPRHAENFSFYVNRGHYDGTIFHRVIGNFMIQGGGFTVDLEEKQTFDQIEIESDNGLSNKRCTLSAARQTEPDSAQAQFFINLVDNSRALDYRSSEGGQWGYTVFGHVINGMSVVDYIGDVLTGGKGLFASDVPLNDIIINSVKPLACGDTF